MCWSWRCRSILGRGWCAGTRHSDPPTSSAPSPSDTSTASPCRSQPSAPRRCPSLRRTHAPCRCFDGPKRKRGRFDRGQQSCVTPAPKSDHKCWRICRPPLPPPPGVTPEVGKCVRGPGQLKGSPHATQAFKLQSVGRGSAPLTLSPTEHPSYQHRVSSTVSRSVGKVDSLPRRARLRSQTRLIDVCFWSIVYF